MSDITLKILSSAFFIGPFIQRHNMGLTRIQMLCEPLDRSDLARSIAALKPQKKFLIRFLPPVLHLKQLNLQRHILSIINAAPQPFGIGIFTLLKPSDLLRSNLPICGFQFVMFVRHGHSCRLNQQ